VAGISKSYSYGSRETPKIQEAKTILLTISELLRPVALNLFDEICSLDDTYVLIRDALQSVEQRKAIPDSSDWAGP
jgi:hypothetical protein